MGAPDPPVLGPMPLAAGALAAAWAVVERRAARTRVL